MTLETTSLQLVRQALAKLEAGFDLPDWLPDLPVDAMTRIMDDVAERMRDNYPYFHPLFAGQMLKPPHPLAKAAYMLAMWINPNNHALDGGRASSQMEKEAVADLARMLRWDTHLGHLTGGGTMANMEALWVAGQVHPGKTVIASDQAHYTHERICSVLNLPFERIASTNQGILDVNDLIKKCDAGNIGTVVCTMGTTGTGSVDPLDEVLQLQKRYGFRIHADAAYGGYFALVETLSPETIKKYDVLDRIDSIVIDPHKHGLQPYGCGCILFKDPEVAQYYLHDSPYTYFTSDALHLGEISLECSRPGAAAVGLWATHQLLPPVRNGSFAADLSKSREAATNLYDRLQKSSFFTPIVEPETDIVVWTVNGSSTEEMSEKTKQVYDLAETKQLYLSLYKYPTEKLAPLGFSINSESLLCLRSCLMKPDHIGWMDDIWKRLEESVTSIF